MTHGSGDAAPRRATSVLTAQLLNRFAERRAKYDSDNTFFSENFEELRQIGYLRLAVPTELGGLGSTLVDAVREQRRLAYYAPATALAINMHLYWTGVAADLFRAGDASLQWLLEGAFSASVPTKRRGGADQALTSPPLRGSNMGRATHKETSTMSIGKVTTHFGLGIIGWLTCISLCPSIAQAQDHHLHAAQNDRHPLVKAVRQATERFKDVAAAEAEGYALQFGCVSGPDFGAMGLHYVKPSFFDGEPDPTRPEAIIYEPLPDGRLKLIGAEYVVPAELWDTTHEAAPQLMGQLFHLLEGPNRFGRASLYALHVWAWKENPNGAFVNWHPNVSCEAFNPLLPGLASIDLPRLIRMP